MHNGVQESLDQIHLGKEHTAAAESAILYNSGLEAMLRREHEAALLCFQVLILAKQ